jgi:hypothetical protein
MDAVDLASVTAPNDINALPKLLWEVTSRGDALVKRPDAPLVYRLELLAKVRELERALQTPREMMIRQLWVQVRRSDHRMGTRTGMTRANTSM